MSGDEAIGRLFNYNLELLSHDFELHFDQVVGQQVTVALDLPVDKRYFNGYITEFRYMGQTDRYARYQATLRPWFWFLTRTSDCRIFQEKKVPDIIKDIFQEHGMSDVEYRLRGTYREWEYCVQYRETDFNFISRLMEQEGLYYYFEHFEDKHMLILTDEVSTHTPFPQFETIPYHSPSGQVSAGISDHLQYWAVTQSIQPESYAIKDFDFKNPGGDLLSILMQPGDHAFPIEQPEIFDYPGEYNQRSDGDSYVEIRLQELRSQHERVSGGGPCRGLSAGCLFTLMEYPREDQNKEYLVLSVSHQINDTSYVSNGGGIADELYQCQVEVMDSTVSYRQVRSTPKPIVQGPQTAIVVGRESDEIYTDEFGRVKVQFHWDRYGERNENSSCWIRVSQLWAGAKWGGMHIPRIGQEVIVSFMEGDPDKPVITGRVYNADCMPPYDLPANKTQSGIKSRSSKDGTSGNFNEFRFEDKKGSESITLHAEKDLNTTVENDESRNVINTRAVTVGAGDNARPTETIESLQVHGQRLVDIRGNDGLSVSTGDKGRKVHIIDANYELDIDKGHYILGVDLGNAQTTVKAGNITSTADAGNIVMTSTAASTTITAGTSIVLTVGGNSITVDTGKVELKSPAATVTVDASGVKISGPAINSEATGVQTIKGAMVNIN
ncbi:MAG: type VI secretion system tip protein VgrG, partial [Lysobacterales bacterium]